MRQKQKKNGSEFILSGTKSNAVYDGGLLLIGQDTGKVEFHPYTKWNEDRSAPGPYGASHPGKTILDQDTYAYRFRSGVCYILATDIIREDISAELNVSSYYVREDGEKVDGRYGIIPCMNKSIYYFHQYFGAELRGSYLFKKEYGMDGYRGRVYQWAEYSASFYGLLNEWVPADSVGVHYHGGGSSFDNI